MYSFLFPLPLSLLYIVFDVFASTFLVNFSKNVKKSLPT
uniref:Uncharacterized protein n=1 Tax=Myoviridae sp. ctaNG1 TaxID=2825132 RepID=A0A8S5P9U4_9CAUD|nr:MAG TPA: hypothetical protein [Myoviridae sp. ctaNG1]